MHNRAMQDRGGLHPHVRLSPLGVKLLNALSQPYAKTRTQLDDIADAHGWRVAQIPVGITCWQATSELLRLGPEAEVLAPRAARLIPTLRPKGLLLGERPKYAI